MILILINSTQLSIEIQFLHGLIWDKITVLQRARPYKSRHGSPEMWTAVAVELGGLDKHEQLIAWPPNSYSWKPEFCPSVNLIKTSEPQIILVRLCGAIQDYIEQPTKQELLFIDSIFIPFFSFQRFQIYRSPLIHISLSVLILLM